VVHRTFITAIMYGMASKSLVVNSVSPRALIFLRVSMISSRSLAWTSGCLASSYKPHAIYLDRSVIQITKQWFSSAYSDGGSFVGREHDRPGREPTINPPLRERKGREDMPHLWDDLVITKLGVSVRRSVCFHYLSTPPSALAEPQPDKDELTEERHNVLLTLSLLNSFALEID